jgi:hypothetical protein
MRKKQRKCGVETLYSFNWVGRPRASVGVWSGDGLPQARVMIALEGTDELALRSGDEPEKTEEPLIGECALAACLRAAASFVKPIKHYSPSRTAGGFLPFLQVERCVASCVARRRVASEKIEGAFETVYSGWRLEAELNIAHSQGVSEETIRELIAVSGYRIGLGLHSPYWKGSSGTFVLSSLTLVSGAWPPPGAELVMLGPIGEKLGRGDSIDFLADSQ